MIKTPIGYCVLVSAQIGDDFIPFIGIALRHEDGYCPATKYMGKISVARYYTGWGQNEILEIIHNIPHIDKQNSLTCWAYPEEISKIYWNFQDWNYEAREITIDIAKYLGLYGHLNGTHPENT